jgi:hypothetical protein
MTERTTVRLPPDLLARAKRKAAAEGRTLTSLIEDGLRAVINDRTPAKGKRRVVLPVSKATGGPRPGFEFIRLSDIDAIEDAEYVERMNRGFK